MGTIYCSLQVSLESEKGGENDPDEKERSLMIGPGRKTFKPIAKLRGDQSDG